MFVAIRDLRFARGRFALMGSVVALLTLLVVLLSGLTAGLGRASTSAITELPADHLVFSRPPAGAAVSFADSRLDRSTVAAWSAVPGVISAESLAITMSRADAGPASSAVAVFAVRPGSALAPAGMRPGQAVLSTGVARALHAVAGDRISVGGTDLTVTAVLGDASYSHAGVIWTASAPGTGNAQPGESAGATVIALTTAPGTDLAAADARDRKSTRLNSSHRNTSRMPSSA